MVYSLYSVFDKVAGEYSAPSMAQNDGVALRWFMGLINKSELDPRDFQLYKVGTFNAEIGEIVPCNIFIKQTYPGEQVNVEVLRDE